MKIIIEHKGIKRVIEGTGFNICASAQDIGIIAEAIRRSEMSGFGWIKIREEQPDNHSAAPNTEPIPWTHLYI
jgi:hypothetical protein